MPSWLFTRGFESIWIERPGGSTLIVAGPGYQRDQREFPDDEALHAFRAALAEKLSGTGWSLLGYDYDRRIGGDRRRTPRDTRERRQPMRFSS